MPIEPSSLRRARLHQPPLIACLMFGLTHLPHASATPKPAREVRQTPTQTLHDAVAAAWARMPMRQAYAARQVTAAANYASGGALVPNAPTATGSYVNDKVAGSNYNYITSQVGVTTPVWLPGEGTATQKVAQADSAAIAAEAEAQHLALAAQVLDLAAQATTAANARDVATQRLATGRALSDDLARRFQVGESSQSDALAAEADAASAQVALQTDEAQLGAARIAIAGITGSAAIPVLELPASRLATGASGVSPGHPAIVMAEQAVAAAQANARLVRIADRDDPEVGVQGINEKQPGTRWDTRFGVTVTFHFATEARNAPRRAAAEQAVTQAQVQLAVAQRAVATGIKQAEALLAGAQLGNDAAGRAATALEKRRGQVERAWRLGEMPLIELVRANALAFDAGYARDLAQTTLQTSRLRLLLAQGVLP